MNLIASIGFYPERIKEPLVILGLIIILIGALCAIFAKNLAPKLMKNSSVDNVIIMKFISLAIVVIGCLIAVIKI